MPELVEVETTRRQLSKVLENKTIRKVSVFLDKIVYNDKENFINKLEENTIKRIDRRGKWLLFELIDDYLIVHFRMEGRFYLLDKNSEKSKHDYVIFEFEDFSLHYNDPRLFGKMEIIKKDGLKKFFDDKNLGLEYDDERLTPKYLKEKFKNHSVEIKKILLDQSFITGIGNIYANEILFESRINPKTKANRLSKNKLNEIIKNTKLVFEKSLEYNGTYPNIDGKRGEFEKYFKVHGRKNEDCYVCGSKIVKEEIGSRGTYYCPLCQKKS